MLDMTLANGSKQYPLCKRTLRLVVEPPEGRAYSMRPLDEKEVGALKWMTSFPETLDLIPKNPRLTAADTISGRVVFEFSCQDREDANKAPKTLIVADHVGKQFPVVLVPRKLSWI